MSSVTTSDVFTVQECIDPDGPVFDRGRTVEAQGALAAAEDVIGERLRLSGSKHTLAGRVIGLDSGYRPTSVFVYRDSDDDGAPRQP